MYGMYSLNNVKKEYFLKNGAMLKRKQIEYWGERALPIRIFSAEELRRTITSRIIHDKPMRKGRIDGRSFIFDLSPCSREREWVIHEIAIQANISHRNVLRILGCCLETRCPIPIYESISKDCRSLSDHLRGCDRHRYGRPAAKQLRWSDRIRIAAEVADALNYLHIHSSMAIIHRDIRPANILLDDRLTAKLTSFHWSVAMPPDRRGVFRGCVSSWFMLHKDPTYRSTTHVVNEKMDVYSLGTVMFLLLIGIECACIIPDGSTSLEIFPSYLKKGRYAEIPFEGKTEQIQAFTICDGKTEQVEAFCELTLKCIDEERESRPTMKEVVQALRQIKNM